MKAFSFLPAATRMIYDMGLQDLLYGVTFECPPEAAGKPAVVRCLLEGHSYSSEEIDRIFPASKAQGKSHHPGIFSVPVHLQHKYLPVTASTPLYV